MFKQLEKACFLSEELEIHINMLYHTNWEVDTYKKLSLLSIKKMINQIRGYNVYILLENSYGIESYDKKGCNCVPIDLCKFFGEKQLKVCFDICHAHVSANIRKESIEEYMDFYLNKEDASKYVYQIHFSSVEKADGFKEKKHTELCTQKEKILRMISNFYINMVCITVIL